MGLGKMGSLGTFRLSIALICAVVSVVTAQGTHELVVVKRIEANLPEALFKSVGTRTFNVQYFRLFLDMDVKAYVIKAWLLSASPLTEAPRFEVRLLNPRTKATVKYDFATYRSGLYYRLAPVFVLCPQDYRIFVNNQELPYETFSKGEENIEIPVHGEIGPALRVLKRTASGFEEVFEGIPVSRNDEVFLQIVAGTFPTGGYSIQVNEPDVVFPVSGKRGQITLTGTFIRPGKGDVVTQAFTTPTKTVSLGRLPAGDYDVFVKIDGLGEFLRTLRVQ